MDNPPPSYNPNESVLSGGINSSTPIDIVQGGGGSQNGGNGPLNGYNETASVLEGGITNNNSPIVQLTGGGSTNVQVVQNYKLLDLPQYNNFVQMITSGEKLKNGVAKLKAKYKPETVLSYRKAGDLLESSVNSNTSSNFIQIKVIPKSTKTLIILPPFDSAEIFVNQIMFLVNNSYCTIKNKKQFVLNSNIFVISLLDNTIFNKDELVQLIYYKLKLINPNSFYRINDPFVFLYPHNIGTHNGLLLCNNDFTLREPLNTNSLSPLDFDFINDEEILSFKYRASSKIIDNNLATISNGTSDPPIPTNEYNFSIKDAIVIIPLKDEDEATITIDLQGKFYRIRVPESSIRSLDKVFNEWNLNHYTRDEEKLIEDFHLRNISDFDIPQFLFHLSYFKCFDDASLLTKAECSTMKAQLQQLYLYSLEQHNSKEKYKPTDTNDKRIIEAIDCSEITGEEKVKCNIVYYEDNPKNKINSYVILDKSYIPFIHKDIKKLHEDAEKEFRKTK